MATVDIMRALYS